MGLRSKTVTIASALAGLAVFSQAPEFAQQYRQRIGGAVDELNTVVVDFDKDASESQMSRQEALNKLTRSLEQFPRDRGESMTRTIGRFERLHKQQGWLENSHPLTRPLLVLKNPDSILLNKAWDIFEPAVPLTGPGAIYGGLGALLAMFLARFGIGGARRVGKARSDRRLVSGIEDVEVTAVANEAPVDEDEPYPTALLHEDDVASSEALARRMEVAVSPRKGIPETMQVAPVRPANVPYLKVEPVEANTEVRSNGRKQENSG